MKEQLSYELNIHEWHENISNRQEYEPVINPFTRYVIQSQQSYARLYSTEEEGGGGGQILVEF
jgi:hypothetical protein